MLVNIARGRWSTLRRCRSLLSSSGLPGRVSTSRRPSPSRTGTHCGRHHDSSSRRTRLTLLRWCSHCSRSACDATLRRSSQRAGSSALRTRLGVTEPPSGRRSRRSRDTPATRFRIRAKVLLFSSSCQSLIAQLAEQPAVNRQVDGSSPSQGAIGTPALRRWGSFVPATVSGIATVTGTDQRGGVPLARRRRFRATLVRSHAPTAVVIAARISQYLAASAAVTRPSLFPPPRPGIRTSASAPTFMV